MVSSYDRICVYDKEKHEKKIRNSKKTLDKKSN